MSSGTQQGTIATLMASRVHRPHRPELQLARLRRRWFSLVRDRKLADSACERILAIARQPEYSDDDAGLYRRARRTLSRMARARSAVYYGPKDASVLLGVLYGQYVLAASGRFVTVKCEHGIYLDSKE